MQYPGLDPGTEREPYCKNWRNPNRAQIVINGRYHYWFLGSDKHTSVT